MISPDVMSAVEFCREKILEIAAQVKILIGILYSIKPCKIINFVSFDKDFENWFRAKHPDCFVTRNVVNSESNT